MRNGWYDEFGYLKHYVNDKEHNENGPAKIWDDGGKFWLQNNKLHRLDGPAAEWSFRLTSWFYQGKRMEDVRNQSEFERKIKLKILW